MVLKGLFSDLRAAVATAAAAPASTKMSVAAVRKVEDMMVVGRECQMDALWRADVWGKGGN